MPQNKFNAWVADAMHSDRKLDMASYNTLARPSSYVTPSYYASVDPSLYDTIMLKYMMPINSEGKVVSSGANS